MNCCSEESPQVFLLMTTCMVLQQVSVTSSVRRSIRFVWRYALSQPPLRSQTNIQHPVGHNFTHFRLQQHPISAACSTTSPTTSCALDPLPTWLLKDISDTLIPFLTRLVNSSIASSVVPHCLKHANVIPVLKKANLDHNTITNSYRPISNLPFVSKLLERYVTRCLIKHLTDSNLLERYQSAYKSHHSMETALVLVQKDIIEALDQRYGIILVLLDISAAFDTVDNEILLSRLEQHFRMSGPALMWMRSYLTGRSQ